MCLIAGAAHTQQTLSQSSAVRIALGSRESIKAARLNLDQAVASARALGAYPAPELGLGYSTRPEIGGTDHDLFLSQKLDIFGRRTAGKKVGEAMILEAAANYRAAQISVQDEVLRALSEAAAAIELNQLSSQLLEVSEKLKTAAERRLEEGRIPEVQVTRAAIEHSRALQASHLRTAQMKAAISRLAGALGYEAASPLDVDPALLISLPEGHRFPDHRADLMLLKAQIQSAQADQNLIKAGNKPELKISARRSGWNGGRANYGARIQLSMPVGPSGQVRSQLKAAKHRAAAGEAALKDATLLAVTEIEAINTELKAAIAQRNAYHSIAKTAADLVRKSQIGFDKGASTLVEVLDATRAQREVEEEAAQAQLRVALITADLFRASGFLIGGEK